MWGQKQESRNNKRTRVGMVRTTEGALCTGEIRKGPLRKPLFGPLHLRKMRTRFDFCEHNWGFNRSPAPIH